MKKAILLYALVGAFLTSVLIQGCSSDKPAPVRLIPMEDFFRNPEQSGYQISPNGKYYSFMAPYERRMNIFVQQIGREGAIRLTNDTLRDIAGYLWAGDDRILYLNDTGGDENYKLFVVDADGTNLKSLTDFDGVRTTFIDPLVDIPEEVIIGLNKRDAMVFDPYRLNIITGELTMLAQNPGNIQGWMTDHDGKLRIAIAIVDGVNQALLYRDTEDEEFRTVLTVSFKETLSPAIFTFDNKNVYAISNLGRDKAALVEFDIANGKEIRMLYENPDYDISSLADSRKRKIITSVSYTSWKRERHFFDEETKNLFDFLYKTFPGYELGITSMSKEEDKMIIRTYNDRSLGAYYLFDINTKDLTKIVELGSWFSEDELASMYPVQYKSRDGLTIHGYLTLPVGYSMKKAKNLPVIVNPHGGPWARDSWGFNSEVQFLANRGYAVFQMNFRGSTGYGKEFFEKSFKQWGLAMQDDITDGVKWLIDKGIADKERIAIYGGSYGGYATLAGLTLTPELYAAGVDYVGVSNLFTFLNTIPPYWKPMLEIMYEMVGHPQYDSIQFIETSPVFLADQITAPLFIAQGANDPRVNKNESDQMVEALKARGVEVEYMVKYNEGHGFGNEENRFEFYGAMEKFLAKHLMNND